MTLAVDALTLVALSNATANTTSTNLVMVKNVLPFYNRTIKKKNGTV